MCQSLCVISTYIKTKNDSYLSLFLPFTYKKDTKKKGEGMKERKRNIMKPCSNYYAILTHFQGFVQCYEMWNFKTKKV